MSTRVRRGRRRARCWSVAVDRGRTRRAIRLHLDGARSRAGEHATHHGTRRHREGQHRVASLAERHSLFPRAGADSGLVYENELYKRFLPEITLAEINAMAKSGFAAATASSPTPPPSPKAGLPFRLNRLAAVIATAADKELKVEPVAGCRRSRADCSMAKPPTPGKHHKETTKRQGSGPSEWDAVERRHASSLKPTDVQGRLDPVRRDVSRWRHAGEGRGYIRQPRFRRISPVGGVGKLDPEWTLAEDTRRQGRSNVGIFDLRSRIEAADRRTASEHDCRDHVAADLSASMTHRAATSRRVRRAGRRRPDRAARRIRRRRPEFKFSHESS